jgi:SOS-response transcriptional repressor LexA
MPRSDQQRRVLEAIEDRLRRQGYPPTVKELVQHLAVSIGTIQAHLRALSARVPSNDVPSRQGDCP